MSIADIVPVRVPSNRHILDADLGLPATLRGIVIFAHGSGSGRHSSRNRHVAEVLQRAGIATLLLDLLTPEEEAIDDRTRQIRFDIPLLHHFSQIHHKNPATQIPDHTQIMRDEDDA